MLENSEIYNSAQVVNVGKEDNLNTSLNELVKNARVVQRFEDISVSGRVPIGDRRFEGFWCRQERILQDSWISRLVEGQNVDIVALVFLDDILSIIICVEGVHENEWYVHIICSVKVLNLSNRQVKEGHAITDFDDRLGSNASHGGTETTIELEDGKLAQESDGLGVGELVIVNDQVLSRGLNAVPVPDQNLANNFY